MRYKYDLLTFQCTKCPKRNSNIFFYPFSKFENINQVFQFARSLTIIYTRVESCTAVINLRNYLNVEQALYLAQTFTPCKS